MPAYDHTPRGHAARYTPACYDGMRDDHARTGAYREAITAAAQGKVIIDLGTGALALLAIFAAEAGAKHVYAIEVQPVAAAAARRTINEAGLSDRITVIEGFSTDPHVVLPEKADLLVHELIGEIAGEEGVVAAIADARKRHLAPTASTPFSIPSRTTTLLAPSEYPNAAYCADRLATTLEAPGGGQALKLPGLPRTDLLAAPQVFEDLRFEEGAPAPSQAVELEFVAERAGWLRGLSLHVELHCRIDGAAAPPDVSSAWSGSHWRNLFLLLGDGMALARGDLVRVHATAELNGPQPRYTFRTRVCAAASAAKGSGGWVDLGGTIEYPEASLNVNDACDLMMAQD
jgi:type I protein arginine methyltransferase